MMQQYNVVPVGQPTISECQSNSTQIANYLQLTIFFSILQVRLVQRLQSQREQ